MLVSITLVAWSFWASKSKRYEGMICTKEVLWTRLSDFLRIGFLRADCDQRLGIEEVEWKSVMFFVFTFFAHRSFLFSRFAFCLLLVGPLCRAKQQKLRVQSKNLGIITLPKYLTNWYPKMTGWMGKCIVSPASYNFSASGIRYSIRSFGGHGCSGARVIPFTSLCRNASCSASGFLDSDGWFWWTFGKSLQMSWSW